MKRRTVVAGLCALAIAPAAAAQPRVPKIGILLVGNPEPALGLLRSGLRERGYIEGKTVSSAKRSRPSALCVPLSSSKMRPRATNADV